MLGVSGFGRDSGIQRVLYKKKQWRAGLIYFRADYWLDAGRLRGSRELDRAVQIAFVSEAMAGMQRWAARLMMA